MKNIILFFTLALLFIWQCTTAPALKKWIPYDETEELAQNATNKNPRLRYKRIQSKHTDKNSLFIPFENELIQFESSYARLSPFILERSIPELQSAVALGIFSYEELTLFYLYRIYRYETDPTLYLNAILALNPDVVQEAREKDLDQKKAEEFPLYGMPILLKDNINTANMPTTAGAAVFKKNQTKEDAYIVNQLKKHGALILGKLNLSEWAYYFCEGCPLGYSALGGQTLNPYGRKVFESGGSSSGSGVAAGANYAVATVGTETSGSILSPAAKNALFGLKPTIGAVSRSGIIPISSTFDTAGPMTKTVVDNLLLYNALIGYDKNDLYSYAAKPLEIAALDMASLKGKRFGMVDTDAQDSLLQRAAKEIQQAGGEVIEVTLPEIDLDLFVQILDTDMKVDLPKYIASYGHESLSVKNIADIIAFNNQNADLHAPYGQGIFKSIAKDTTDYDAFQIKKKAFMKELTLALDSLLEKHQLDAFLTLDYFTSSYLATAHYSAIGIPIGYYEDGKPQNMSMIAKGKQEQLLIEMAAAYEKIAPYRKLPEFYP